MPDRFSNPRLTPADIAAIQHSSADPDLLATRYRLMTAEVKHIQGHFAAQAIAAPLVPMEGPEPKTQPTPPQTSPLKITEPF